MDLADVMDELATQLGTISDLRVYAYPPDTILPGVAFTDYPQDITFDETYGRGKDRMTVPVVVVVGKTNDRATVETLGAYCNGSGPRSVKQVVEAGTYTAFGSLRVMNIEFEVVTYAGADFMAARFDVDISGKGST